MRSLATAWLAFTIGIGVVFIHYHAKEWIVVLTFLFTIPLSAWSAAYWWSR